MRGIWVAFTMAALLAGCASDDNRTPRAEQRWVADGPEVSCINRNQVRSTEVVDDQHHQLRHEQPAHVRQPPAQQPARAWPADRTFTVNSRTTQFCSANTITVITGPGGQRGATCGLGRFQPVVREDAPPAAPANGR